MVSPIRSRLGQGRRGIGPGVGLPGLPTLSALLASQAPNATEIQAQSAVEEIEQRLAQEQPITPSAATPGKIISPPQEEPSELQKIMGVEPSVPGFPIERVIGDLTKKVISPILETWRKFALPFEAEAIKNLPGVPQERKDAIEAALKKSLPGGIVPFATRTDLIERELDKVDLPPGVRGTLQILSDPLFFIGAPAAGIKGPITAAGRAAEAKAIQAARAELAAIPRTFAPKGVPSEGALLREGVNPNWAKTTADEMAKWRVGSVHPLREFIRHINPSAVAGGPVEKGTLSFNRLLEFGDNSWTPMGERMRTVAKDAFRFDSEGRLINAVAARPGVNPKPLLQDFMERRADYLPTSAQAQVQGMFDELKDFVVAAQKAEGITVRELAFGEGEKYFTRLVTAIKDVTVRVGIRKMVGAKQSIQKTRFLDMAEDGVQHGVQYTTDVVASTELLYKASMKRIADQRLINALSGLPGVRTAAAAMSVRIAREQAILEVRGSNAYVRAIDLAKRGKDVPGFLVRRVEDAYESTGLREVVLALKGRPGVRTEAVQRGVRGAPAARQALGRAMLDDMAVEAATRRGVAREAASSARIAFKNSLERARQIKPEEGIIRQPGFGGKIFPKEIADQVNRFFERDLVQPFRALRTLSSASVTLGTTVDVGWGFIQGLALLASNPRAWIQAQKISLQTVIKPEFMGKYLSNPERFAAAQRASERGLVLQATGEMVEQAAGIAGLFRKIPVVGRFIGGTFERFGQAFTNAGNVARLEWYMSLEPLALRRGGQALDELVDVINKATGTLSTRALGVSRLQQGIETMTLFAPRYTRSAFGLMGDALQGGMRGEVARATLARMATAGTVMYMALGELLGQEPHLDPRPVSLGGSGGKFFTYRIAGQNVGVGGAIMSISRLLSHAYAAAKEDPGAFVRIDGGKDNPFLRFMRSRISPIGAATWETVTGRNFIGESTDFGSNPLNWSKEVLGSRMLPFWAEAYLFDNPRPGTGGVGEFMGLRTFPVGLWERRNDLRNEHAEGDFARPWDELTVEEQILVQRNHPDLDEAAQLAREQSLDRADSLGLLIHDRQTQVLDARERLMEKLEKAQREFDTTTVNPRTVREKIDDALDDYREAWVTIENSEKFTEVRDYFTELGDDRKKAFGDIAYEEYVAVVLGDPRLVDEFDNYDFELRQRVEALFQVKWGQEVYDYVRRRIETSRADRPPIVRELQQGRERPEWRAYWSVTRVLLEQMNRIELLPLYEEFKKADPVQKDILLERFPELKQLDNAAVRARQLMREKNKSLDAFLFRFGYTTTVRHADNEGREDMILNFG